MAVAPDLETAAAESYAECIRISQDAGLSLYNQVTSFMSLMFGTSGVFPTDDAIDQRVVRDWYAPIAYAQSLLEGTGNADTTDFSATRQASPIERVIQATIVAEGNGTITAGQATDVLAAWNTAIGGA